MKPTSSLRLRANSTAMRFLRLSPFSYEPIKQEEPGNDESFQSVFSRKNLWSNVRQYSSRRLLGAAVVLALLTLLPYLGSILVSSSWSHRPSHAHQDQAFYFLLQTSHPDNEVCKAMLTAGIAGYPTPYLVTWDPQLDVPANSSERDHFRIGSIYDWLSKRSQKADDDLVLLLGGSNSWFQLRLETVLKRYYDINQRADRRLHKSLGRRAIAAANIAQSVIFSAQKSCVSNTPDDVSCYAIPESPLSRAETRELRYPSVSTIIGPVKQLRSIFARASAKAKNRREVNMVAIFQEILGEQEFQREVTRQKHWSLAKRAWQSLIRVFGFGKLLTDPVAGRKLMQEEADIPYEFGIGIDYANELSVSISQSLDHIEWRKHLRGSSPRLPTDIATSMPPYWTPSGYGVPSQQSWEETMLLVDKRTRSVPAVINFESYGSGQELSALQSHEWKNLWPQSHARKLYEAAMSIPRLPLVSVVDASGVEHTFWDHETRLDRSGAKTIDGAWQTWDGVCGSADAWRALEG